MRGALGQAGAPRLDVGPARGCLMRWRAGLFKLVLFKPVTRLHLLLAGVLLLLGGCSGSQLTGPRPAQEPMIAVEAYLQEYQEGPLPRVFQTTRLYDRNGLLLAEVYGEGRRTWVELDQISRHLINATIATEDAAYYSHRGVDPVRIIGALWQNFDQEQIVSGASTITMQLARNLFMGLEQRYDQSLDRKILEAGLAQELTQIYSKDEILEMYLNLLNYGHMAYGPEAAAQVYFGKPAINLTLAEATLLAGVPQQPANLDLFVNWEGAKARQRTVLDLMVRHGYLTPEGADAVFAAPVELRADPDRSTVRAPHFVQYVIDSLDRRLGRGYTRRAGLNLITTLDFHMQEVAQQIVAQQVSELQSQFDLNNGALVAMKPGKAEILAMVGSADFTNAAIDGQVNVAVSMRQPGSSIKPVLFALAMDQGLIAPASVLVDEEVTYDLPDGTTYTPLNYDRKFHGKVSARTALANSYNVPAVKLLDQLGVEEMVAGAREMGLLSLSPEPGRYGLSLTLGGGEVTLLDMVNAYHTLANGGRYLPPVSILSMTDSRGRAVNVTPPEPQPVLSEAAAFMVTDMLDDDAARAPSFAVDGLLNLSRPAAVKTGTTDDWRDNWTIGYTRYLVAGVWAGNSDGRPMRDATGITGAAPIWHDFMEAVLADDALLALLGAPQGDEGREEAAWRFVLPAAVERLNNCPRDLPVDLICPEGGDYFSQAWLRKMRQGG